MDTRPYAREFIQQQVDLGDLSFVHKTQAQLEETKEINGMARLLFPIFLECQFIPVSYIIFLAVLMNTNDEWQLVATSTFLNNRSFIDLWLNSGVATLKPAITDQPIKPPETAMYANNDHQDSTKVCEQNLHPKHEPPH